MSEDTTDRKTTAAAEQPERESLLSAIWLATSPRQVKDLWSKVAELLGDEPTQFKRDALAIPLVADE